MPLLIVLTAVGADSALRKIQSRGDPALFRKMQYCAAALCRAIAAEPRQYRFVYLHAARECNLGDDLWINPDVTAEIENGGSLPAASDIPPGSLVLTGDVHGLPEDRIADFVALAARMNSAHTLRTSETVLGLVATVSFCYQCPPP